MSRSKVEGMRRMRRGKRRVAKMQKIMGLRSRMTAMASNLTLRK